MTKQELTDMVLVRMNEFPGDTGISFEGSDRVKAATLVKSLLTEAYRAVSKVVPIDWLPVKQLPTTYDTYLIADPVHGTGYIVLPDDYMELHTLRLKGWFTSLHTTIASTSDEAKLQQNIYVRGSVTRPKGVLDKKTINNVVKNILYYYSLPIGTTNHVVEEALYIPLVDITAMQDSNTVGLDARMIPAICYMAASLAYGVLEKADAQKYCESRVPLFIN